MAIMKKGPVAFDDAEDSESPELAGPAPTPNEMGIDNEAVDAVEGAEPASPEAETATLDAGMLGGKKVAPGDVVKLEVVGVSDEDGTVTVKYATPKTGGIDAASAAFNEGP